MPAAAAPIDYFERALAEAAIGGAGLSVRLRLAQLRRELEARDIKPDDPRIPAYIAAILPPSPRIGAGLTQSPGEGSAGASSVPANGIGLDVRLRHFRWRRMLKFAAPLLCLMVAPNIVRLPRPPQSCTGVDCPGPIPGKGTWVPQPDFITSQANPAFFYWLAAILMLGILTWVVLRMRVYRLQKDSNPDVEPTMNLAVRLGRAHLFAGPDMEKLMRLLRLRRNVTSRRIDVKASLRATISQGGFPVFRFGVNRIRPEYLILSEREMIGDHLPEIGRALHARMDAAQVDSWHYEFQGVPNSLRHDHIRNRHGFESVETVKRRHSDARAFLCAESFDIASGLRRNASWVETLVGEQQPLLLNPRSKEHWHDPENEFLHAGFGSLFAGEFDARQYAGFLAKGASNDKTASYAADDEHDLPAFLAEDRDLLLSPMPIAAQEVEAIVANLEHWLDSTEMTWLRTIALFPLLHPGFTHFSGLILSEGKGMDAGRYLKIARLPWLRAGFMPDWLRQALVHGMTADEFAEAKSTIQSFFAPEAQRARSADDFIAVHEKEKSKRRKNRFEKRLARSAIPALSDTLLINAFASSAPEDVSLDLPDKRHRHWYQHALVQAAALTAAGALAVLSLVGRTSEVRISNPPIWLPKDIVASGPDIATATPKNGPPQTGATGKGTKVAPTATTNLAPISGGDPPLSPKEYLAGPFIVYFDWDKSELTPEAIGYLIGMIGSAAPNEVSAEISCFSDAEFGPAHSLTVSEQRCETLYQFLREKDFGRVSWTAFGYAGGLKPATKKSVRDPGSRRAEITLYERPVRTTPQPPPVVRNNPVPPPDSVRTSANEKNADQIAKIDAESDARYDRGDFEGAFQLNAQSCDLGGVRGCFWNGYLTESGKTPSRNPNQALSWYSRACQLGAQQACDKVKQLSPDN